MPNGIVMIRMKQIRLVIRIGNGHPPAAEHEPDDVEQGPHLVPPAPPACPRAGFGEAGSALGPSVVMPGRAAAQGRRSVRRQRADAPDAEQHTRHERGAVQRVVPQGQDRTRGRLAALPGAPPGRPAGRNERGTPSSTLPLAPSSAVTVASGDGPRPAADLAAAISAAVLDAVPDGASALARVVQFDDFRRTSKNLAACSAKRIISTAPTEKFAAISTRTAGAREPLRCRRQPPLVEAGGPDDDVAALLDAPAKVIHDRAGMGEVNHHVAVAERIPRFALVDRGGHFHVRRSASRPAHFRAHAPPGAEHADLDHRLSYWRQRRRPRRRTGRSDGQCARPRQHLRGDRAHLVVRHGLDRREDLVDRLQPE